MLTSIFIKAQLLLPQVFLFGANKSTILKKIGGLTKDASDFLIPICTLILVVAGICFMFGDGGRRIGKGMGIGGDRRTSSGVNSLRQLLECLNPR